MKKFLFAICSLLLLAGASCSKDENVDTGVFKAPKELSDSISMYAGATTAQNMVNELIALENYRDIHVSKDEFLKGFQLVLANNGNESQLVGMQAATVVLGQLKQFEEQGVEINRNILLKNFRKFFLMDETNAVDQAHNTEILNDLFNQVETLKFDYETAAQRQAADAAFAELTGRVKAEDPAFKTSPSGLVYKIIEPGEAPLVEDSSMIDILYQGSLADGTVFDSNLDEPASLPANIFIKGFAEGVKMLGKGGKAIFYIPGELGYGAKGVPQVGIEPYATLIFEVEIVDVQNPQ